jgi:formate dehydrogenase
MPHHGTTPHISGTSLSAQAQRPIREEYLIVDKGKLAGTGARSYSARDATRGAEQAA